MQMLPSLLAFVVLRISSMSVLLTFLVVASRHVTESHVREK